jgi:hypothetical protein
MWRFGRWAGIAAAALAGWALAAADPAGEAGARWYRGNLHTHSLWSDGDDYPEMIIEWYKQHGYDFLALSDHNILQAGKKWTTVSTNAASTNAFVKYLQRFGPEWVVRRVQKGKLQVRLKTLPEFRGRFEEPGRFLLIQSEEITDKSSNAPVHVNATNLRELIPPQRGADVVDVLQRNVNAVLDQRRRTGQPMFPHVNHPNFGWAITAEELAVVEGERFFEVYNGHPDVHNAGDATHAGLDRVWDIILALRLGVLGAPAVYGLAVDDAHHYHTHHADKSNPGRGWVMVRAPSLTPTAIVAAIEAGDFYASSGVRLRDVRRLKDRYEVEIEPEEGIGYRTLFLGTRKGFDPASQPVLSQQGEALRVTRRYAPEVGAVLAEVTGTRPSFALKGDELYVRAKVLSTKPKTNAGTKGEFETAWTQPLVTGVK